MKTKTERLLYYLLYGAEQLARPALRNLTASFEEWAYGNGFWRTITELERRELLERKADPINQRMYRVTERGRLVALGGRDPELEWKRRWDGQWRIVLFDIPQVEHAARTRLTRFLRDRVFGRLQNSVWISPDPLAPLLQQFSAFARNVDSFITIEGRPTLGESDQAIVAASWNFEQINSLYRRCLEVLREAPGKTSANAVDRERLRRWAEREHSTWSEAISVDPLLPNALLPADYLGKEAWKVRKQTLSALVR